jgi:Peptidase inhibitor I9
LLATLCAGALAAGVVLAASPASAAAATSAAEAPATHDGATHVPTAPAVAQRQRAAGTDRTTYYVELTGTSVAATFKLDRGRGSAAAKAAATESAKAISSHVATVSADARHSDPDAAVLYSTKNVMPGFAVSTTAQAAAELAARPDVVAVTALTPVTPASTTADEFTQALTTWQNTGLIGTGV